MFLVSLLLVLTFNAYACILPLQTPSQMDCSSTTEQPVRQTSTVLAIRHVLDGKRPAPPKPGRRVPAPASADSR